MKKQKEKKKEKESKKEEESKKELLKSEVKGKIKLEDAKMDIVKVEEDSKVDAGKVEKP